MHRVFCLAILTACVSALPARAALASSPQSNQPCQPATPASSPDSASAAAGLFAKHCLQCHGEGDAPPLNDSALSRDAMREKVRRANSYAMPSFSVAELDNAQLESILEWVRSE